MKEAFTDTTGHRARTAGVSYGADMRLFTERGVPCVMAGTPGMERAHATDEYVELDHLTKLAKAMQRLMETSGDWGLDTEA